MSTPMGEELDEAGSLRRWQGSFAVVTGASVGIGLGVAKAFINAGINVIGLARRFETMQELATELSTEEVKFYPFRCDMRKEEDILEAFKWIDETLGAVSILVNNAGLMPVNTLIEGDAGIWKDTLDVNILALCICTREAVKSMRKHSVNGYIFHMNSIAGHCNPVFPIPIMNMYPATKHGVTVLTEGLRHELYLSGLKIKITSISPGFVYTDILDNFGPFSEAIKSSPALYVEDVANAIMYCLSTPPHVQVHELTIKVVNAPET